MKQIGGPKGGMNPVNMNLQKMMQEAIEVFKSGMNNKALIMPQISADRSVLQKWSMNRSCQNKPHDKWQIVWPSNLDSNKTTKEGRKVGKSVCVCRSHLAALTEPEGVLGIPRLADVVGALVAAEALALCDVPSDTHGLD